MDHKARDCRPNDYNDQEAFIIKGAFISDVLLPGLRSLKLQFFIGGFLKILWRFSKSSLEVFYSIFEVFCRFSAGFLRVFYRFSGFLKVFWRFFGSFLEVFLIIEDGQEIV